MESQAILQQKIIDFLLSHLSIHDADSQRAFVYNIGLDTELQNQIPFGKPKVEFVPILVSTLFKYGKLQDRRHAIEAMLDVAKSYVGHDQKTYCDDILLQELRISLTANTSPLIYPKRKQRIRLSIVTVVFLLAITTWGWWWYVTQQRQPNLTFPTQDETIKASTFPTTVTFSWEPISGAIEYLIDIQALKSGSPDHWQYYTDKAISVKEPTYTQMIVDSYYKSWQWRVTVKYSKTSSKSSEWRQFTLE